MKARSYPLLGAAVAGPLLLLAAPRLLQNRLACPADSRAFEAELKRHIAPGSDVTQAKKLLEQNGFDCEVAPHPSDGPNLKQIGLGSLPTPAPPPAPSLFAKRRFEALPFVGGRKWRAKVRFTKGKVTHVEGGYMHWKWD